MPVKSPKSVLVDVQVSWTLGRSLLFEEALASTDVHTPLEAFRKSSKGEYGRLSPRQSQKRTIISIIRVK